MIQPELVATSPQKCSNIGARGSPSFAFHFVSSFGWLRLYSAVFNMKPFDINQLKTFKDEYPLSYLAVFGSYARGEQTEGSDLDLLVRYSEPVSLFDVVGMQREMSEKLGIEVDLVSEGALSSKIKPYVTPDLQVVFDEK